jgi:hypothetical protein
MNSTSKQGEESGDGDGVRQRYAAPLCSRWRYPAWLALVSIGVAMLIVLFSCPRFVYWRGLDPALPPFARDNPDVTRAIDTLGHLEHPFAPPASRFNKPVAWRLLLSMIWYYLHLPVWLFLILPPLGCLFTLALSAHIVYQRTGKRTWATAAAALLGTCNWFFVSTGWLAMLDSWTMAALLVLSFGRSRTVFAIVCFLMPWIDERMLLAVPICLAIRCIDAGAGIPHRRRELLRDGLAILLPCLAYPLLRVLLARQGVAGHEASLYIEEHFNAARISSMGADVCLEGLWSAFRCGWLFVAVLFWLLWETRRRLAASLLASMLAATLVAGLLLANDFSRMTCLVLPLVLMGVLESARQLPVLLRVGLPLATAANLLLPAAHVCMVNPHSPASHECVRCVFPIKALYTEIQRWRNPPPCLNPKYYVQQGLELVEQNKLDAAEHWFADALKIDEDHGPAYLARAMTRLKLGRLSAAAQDAEQAVRCSPQDPEAYFVRALVRLQRQDRTGAAADLSTALRIAPAEWSRRRESQDMLTKAKDPIRSNPNRSSGTLP